MYFYFHLENVVDFQKYYILQIKQNRLIDLYSRWIFHYSRSSTCSVTSRHGKRYHTTGLARNPYLQPYPVTCLFASSLSDAFQHDLDLAWQKAGKIWDFDLWLVICDWSWWVTIPMLGPKVYMNRTRGVSDSSCYSFPEGDMMCI